MPSRVIILNQPLASPSLWNPSRPENGSQSGNSKAGAYEIKFLVDELLVGKLIPVVQSKMKLDPFADPHSGSYPIEGIYFETSERNVFNKTPGYSRKKFRIRRYSYGATLFLERKFKRNGIVAKKRIPLEASQLSKVLRAEPVSNLSIEPSVQMEMDWFARRIDKLMLRPTLCIAYDRIAFLQMDQLGPIRLTIDRGVGCCRLDQMDFPNQSNYAKILEGKCIVEFKYRESLPNTFRQFIEEFQLKIQPVSKFRQGMLATGLASSDELTTSEGNETC